MSYQLVSDTKAALLARGESLDGPCGAFKVTKRVAWALRASGFGLLSKPSGNNCEGFSVDVILDASGREYDILSDAGGANGPLWPESLPQGDVTRWRAPIDPGDTPQEPQDPPGGTIPDDPGPAPWEGLETRLAALEALVASIQTPSKRTVETNRVWGHTHKVEV